MTGSSRGLTAITAMIAAALLLLASACGGAKSPTSEVAKKPIVLITIDTLRADHVNAKVTPALDRLARESIAFDQGVSVGPLTLPGHASLLTGLFPPAHGLRDNHLYSLPKETATYTAWLKSQGYRTGAFVSSIVLDGRYGLNAGFDTYDDEMLDGAPERSARETLRRAAQWLTSQAATTGQSEVSGTRAPPAGAGAPFFLWIHLFEPHAPYRTGTYASEVTAVDRELDGFFTQLREHGLWNDTILSVTSDHGESLGEHGEATHGYYVYDSTIRIPWILRAPGLTARRVPAQVRLVDVMPTMIALAEIGAGAAPPIAGAHGENLVPYLAKGGFPSLEAYAETFLPRNQFNWSELKAIRGGAASGGPDAGGYKFIDAPDPELYALAQDPAEAKNVIANAAEAPRVASMKKIITGLEQHSKAVAAAAQRQSSDIVEAEKFLSLGYIGQSSPAAAAAPGAQLPDPKKKLAIYQLVMSSIDLNESGRADEALGALKRAAAMDPSVTQVHYLQGLILGGQQRYKEAAAALERTIALNPRHVLARFKLALAWLRLNRTADAEKALQTVLEDEPRNVRAFHNLAAIAYARGDLRRAESLERQALAIEPDYFDAWNTLGAIYVVEKRAAEALDALNKATALRPSSGQAQYNLALALQASGALSAAQAAADKACSLEQRYCR